MYPVLDVSPDTDLSQFSRLLWQHTMSHQILEHEGRKVLLVHTAEHVAKAGDLYQRWRRGEVQPAEQDNVGIADFFNAGGFAGGLLRGFRRTPLTLTLIAVCCVLAIFAPLVGPTPLTFDLMYPDFSYGTRTIVLSRVIDSFGLSELLRMISPMLLHGGLLHLLFNMLCLWELGPRIERAQSSIALGVVIVLLALVSNTVQYLASGRNFGGMSGVIYGLFTYIWMWQLIDPRKGMAMPASLIWFVIISLIIMTMLDLGIIADEAHLGGFFAGVLFGVIAAGISRLRRGKQRAGEAT